MIHTNKFANPDDFDKVLSMHKVQDVENRAELPSQAHWRVLAASASVALAACEPLQKTGRAAPPAQYMYKKAESDEEAARFLQHAQFSSTTSQIATLRGTTYEKWLESAFTQPREQSGWAWLNERGYGAFDTNQYWFGQYPADFMLWKQLLSAKDGFRTRCGLALSEFFVVSLTAMVFSWRSHAVAHYWDTLLDQFDGNFRDLLQTVTLHPAMGYFLNTKGNQKADPATGRVPDENYAREVMQLFTIGVHELNLDGTPKLDASGQRIETYTQSDVTQLAKVFTGYEFDETDGVRYDIPPGHSWTISSPAFTAKPMRLNPDLHSYEALTFLGTTIAEGTSHDEALRIALDTLFYHPNVAPFFCRQMIQRMVTSNPSPAYVARVATQFNNNGFGARGDLRAVWSAILLDDEARGASTLSDGRFGKLREPMMRFIQWGRTFGATSQAGSWKILSLTNPASQLAQSPMRPPSVFGFYRPGYVPPGTALAGTGATAPEFQLLNETTVSGYLNFMQDVLRSGVRCPDPDVPQIVRTSPTYVRDVQATYAQELMFAHDAPKLVQHLSLVLCAGQLSQKTKSAMIAALEATALSSTSDLSVKLDRICAAILLCMSSAEYLIQK